MALPNGSLAIFGELGMPASIELVLSRREILGGGSLKVGVGS